MSRPLLCGAAFALAPLAACATEDVVAYRLDDCDGGRCETADACGPGGCPASNEAGACDDRAILPVGDSLCEKDQVERFRFGLCTCEGYVGQHRLEASGNGPGTPDVQPGSIGINGSLNATGGVSIAGSLIVAGTDGVTTGQNADATIGGDLLDQGVLSGGGRVEIGGDAQIGGDIGVGALHVAGTLVTPEGTAISVTREQAIGERVTAAVDVEPPCSCDPPSRPDIVGAIHDARERNDNARAGLNAFDLEGVDEPFSLDLPCGRYHFSQITGSAPVTLHARGPVALYVDGSIALEDALIVDSAGGPVDLIVEETVRVTGELQLGSAEGNARLVAAGGGTLQIDGAASITGIVYAPGAELLTGSELLLKGAGLFRRVVANGPVRIEHQGSGCRR